MNQSFRLFLKIWLFLVAASIVFVLGLPIAIFSCMIWAVCETMLTIIKLKNASKKQRMAKS